MRKFKRLTLTLALLITAVGGAWAQSSLNVVELKVPAEWETDQSNLTTGDLPGFKTSTKEEAKAWTGAPKTGGAMFIYAFDGENTQYVFFYDGVFNYEENSPFQKNVVFSNSKYDVKFYYTASDTIELTPDADKKVWTLDKMPASNVELQVEYYAESNLFLGKEALADKANIAVKNGETAVAFDDDGKSTTTVTEGNTVTAKFTGKKVLGMKVAKKETTTYKLLSAATAEDIGKVVCAAGHLHEAKTAVPDGCTAVGILGKVTSTGGHGLILALKDAKDQNWNTINGWTSASYAGTTLKVLPDDAARGTNLTSYTTLGETTVSNWAVAQKSDYVPIFVNLGSTNSNEDGTTYDGNVNAYFTGVGGTERSNSYLSTTESDASHAWYFGGGCWAGSDKSDIFSVWPVLGF